MSWKPWPGDVHGDDIAMYFFVEKTFLLISLQERMLLV
jgi:hypothetical protein